jgi:20S proteasome alpha/beta subunit
MTLIVGIQCSDGVVLASDSAATYGTGYQTTIGQQHVTKIHVIRDRVVFCSTGAIGVAQLLIDRIESLHDNNKLTGSNPIAIMRTLGQAIAQEVVQYFQASQASAPLVGVQAAAMPLICKSLIAIPVGRRPFLFQFNEVGVPEQVTDELPFVALGSGQPIADPFLAFLKRVLWKDRQPTLPEGRFGASWTVLHAIQTNPGGVGGKLQLISLGTDGKGKPQIERLDSEGSEQEHFQNIDSVEEAIRQHVRGKGETAIEVPKPVVSVS